MNDTTTMPNHQHVVAPGELIWVYARRDKQMDSRIMYVRLQLDATSAISIN